MPTVLRRLRLPHRISQTTSRCRTFRRNMQRSTSYEFLNSNSRGINIHETRSELSRLFICVDGSISQRAALRPTVRMSERLSAVTSVRFIFHGRANHRVMLLANRCQGRPGRARPGRDASRALSSDAMHFPFNATCAVDVKGVQCTLNPPDNFLSGAQPGLL